MIWFVFSAVAVVLSATAWRMGGKTRPMSARSRNRSDTESALQSHNQLQAPFGA
jgi:hypothetical protein